MVSLRFKSKLAPVAVLDAEYLKKQYTLAKLKQIFKYRLRYSELLITPAPTKKDRLELLKMKRKLVKGIPSEELPEVLALSQPMQSNASQTSQLSAAIEQKEKEAKKNAMA